MGLSLNRPGIAKKPPLPAPRIIPKATAEFEQVVKDETREADRVIAESDAVLDKTPAESPIVVSEQNISGEEDKLNRLIDDDFPFDDTQLTAIYGLAQQQYGVMIGAAGTGKTTTTKKLVDILRDGLDEIDVSKYWQRGEAKEGDADYEIPERLIPSIVMVSFTGRATQMIKKNFPRDWHPNIMTIHRALGFYPDFYQDFDGETNSMVNKRRFIPAYNEDNLMPWDIIIVDEAGMLGLELWHQLWAATKPTCRIIFIGDINQLPPTHGKSILGFALANWPTWELTHVHRQQGANNSIVDNAHRILKGLRPVSDSPDALSLKTPEQMLKALNFMVANPDWRFITVEVPEDHRQASQRIRQCMQLLQGKLYEPNRDVIITPINGYEQTAPGYTLGQAPMNQELVVKLNSKNPRYIIDAGREKQNFATGDKVMATVNDYEAGITNGMTGVITDITENGGYIGDTRRWGLINEVNEYLSGLTTEEDDDIEFSLEEMVSDSQAGMDEMRKKEKRDAGPASHIVEVEFGEGEHAFKIAFSTKSTVASLMLAYCATCHKMQGGECPHVFGIVHQANKRPLNREWFYTMVTRGSHKVVVFTTRQGLGFALGKQNIKGATLEAKVKTFIALTQSGLVGPSVRVKLPQRRGLGTELTPYQPKEIVSAESKAEIQTNAQPAGSERGPRMAQREKPSVKIGSLHIHIHESVQPSPEPRASESHREAIDGGELRAEQPAHEERTQLEPSAPVALPKPESREVIPVGPVHTLAQARRPGPLKLTHKPTPIPTKPLSIGALLAKGKAK
jgi:ATP-dependent exoDNAse (exonuclease V) alpha subunit